MSSATSQPTSAAIKKEALSSAVIDKVPYDIKVQILKEAPDMASMLALTSAHPEFMAALKNCPRATMTKVVIRQLILNGFDVKHPLLDLQHYLGYPGTLLWNNDETFTTGLKALHEVVTGIRETMTLSECFVLLGDGYNAYYFYWLITRIRDLLDQAEAGN